MTKISDVNIEEVIMEARSAAHNTESFSLVEDQIQFFHDVHDGNVPWEWEPYIAEIKRREEDPEYAKLLELAKKYGYKLT